MLYLHLKNRSRQKGEREMTREEFIQMVVPARLKQITEWTKEPPATPINWNLDEFLNFQPYDETVGATVRQMLEEKFDKEGEGEARWLLDNLILG